MSQRNLLMIVQTWLACNKINKTTHLIVNISKERCFLIVNILKAEGCYVMQLIMIFTSEKCMLVCVFHGILSLFIVSSVNPP